MDPDLSISWMVAKLEMFEGWASGCIEDREGTVVDEVRGVPAAYN